jgi:hypothetical protein
MNNKNNKLLNNIMFISAALILPYAYYFMIRPRMINLEKKLEDRITEVKDEDLQKMKKKMESFKSN